MNQIFKNVMTGFALAAFVSMASLAPELKVALAAEQTAEQSQQTLQSDSQKSDAAEHAAHHG